MNKNESITSFQQFILAVEKIENEYTIQVLQHLIYFDKKTQKQILQCFYNLKEEDNKKLAQILIQEKQKTRDFLKFQAIKKLKDLAIKQTLEFYFDNNDTAKDIEALKQIYRDI